MKLFTKIISILYIGIIFSQKLIIPMDLVQTDHLKAYGLAFWILEKNTNIDWILNYRGGSFMVDTNDEIIRECMLRGIKCELINTNDYTNILKTIEQENMDIVLLEKSPKIAVYSPPGSQPWDDAVTLVLTYAEIDYDVIFDDEVLSDKLKKI